jgi:bla regulator protein blaR1
MRKALVFLAALVTIVVAAAAPSSWVAAQAPPASPQFEVASIKPNKSGPGPQRIGFQPGGRFTAVNVPVRDLISLAYGQSQPLPNFQIIGGPGWMASDRFDITAKAEGDFQPGPAGPPQQIPQMIRALLADRFKLVAHEETRDQPIYVLRLDRQDGKLGPQLRPSTVDCAALRGANRGAPPPGPPEFGKAPPCGAMMAPGRMVSGGTPIAMLANSLSRLVSRVVVDQTGLTGNYEATLEFTPDQSQLPPGGLGNLPPGVPAPPVDGPSLFTALKEQLGLKLDSDHGQVRVLIIDSIEPPTPD